MQDNHTTNFHPIRTDAASDNIISSSLQFLDSSIFSTQSVPPHDSNLETSYPITTHYGNVNSPTSPTPSASSSPSSPSHESIFSHALESSQLDHSSSHHEGPILRRSSRARVTPAWLRDFSCPNTITSVETPSSQSNSLTTFVNPYPLFTCANPAHLSHDYVVSLIKVLQTNEPHSYSQAKLCPEWVKAMNQELHALESNHTWVMTTLPRGKKALTSKWVYKTKYKPDGTVDRHNARLVIRGFEQLKGKNYKHTFSPVAKLTTVRLFIALSTARGWPLHQLDINNAFLHGFIDEEVYMLPPEGLSLIHI